MTESPIVELRRYTLHPGRRDTLIELFDREFVETIGNRIFEIRPQGLLDKRMDYDEFLERHSEF